jgi:hypothetical protein
MESTDTLFDLLLRRYLKDASREAVRRRMTRALPRIVRGMEKKHVTPAEQPASVVVRDALFRLWRAVIPSGTLADLVRDLQDDRIVAAVAPLITPETPLPDVVEWTMQWAVAVAF